MLKPHLLLVGAVLGLVGCASSGTSGSATLLPTPGARASAETSLSGTSPSNAAPKRPAPTAAGVPSVAPSAPGKTPTWTVIRRLPEDGSKFHLYSAKNAVIVVVVTEDSIRLPAYLLDAQGLREEPRLLADLPKPLDPASTPTASTPPESTRSVPGYVTFGGEWPNRAQRTYYATGNTGPYTGILGVDHWEAQHWRPEPKFEESYYECSPGTVRCFEARWPDGSRLWERIAPNPAGDGGKSVLYLDADGRLKAPRQRQHSPLCHGSTRLFGTMSGLPLSDGGLIAIGNDCRTMAPLAEYWKGHATRSVISPLPRQLTSITRSYVAAADPVTWAFGTEEDILVAFPMDRGHDTTFPAVLRFDQKQWLDLSPDIPGVPVALTVVPDGSIWLVVEQPATGMGSRLLAYRWGQSGLGVWTDHTPEASDYSGISAPQQESIPDLHFSPGGVLWLPLGHGLLRFSNDRWSAFPLPSCEHDTPDNSPYDVAFLGEAPVVSYSRCVAVPTSLTTAPQSPSLTNPVAPRSRVSPPTRITPDDDEPAPAPRPQR